MCRPGFVGYKCDRCLDNFFLADDNTGCQECPTCYSLVKEEVSCHAQTFRSISHLHRAPAQCWPRGCLAIHRPQACVPTGHLLLSSPSLLIPIHPHLVPLSWMNQRWLLSHPILPSQNQGHTCPVQWGWDDRPDQESPPPLSKQRTTLDGLISNFRIASSSLRTSWAPCGSENTW